MERVQRREQPVRLIPGVVMMCGTLAVAAPAMAGNDAACTDLAHQQFFQTTISSATVVPADAISGRPEHCQVNAIISPAPGSRIGVVYRLPVEDGWNGKLLGIGGGAGRAT